MTDRGEVALDALITAMHDTLCQCGERCGGWDADRGEFLSFVERWWGSSRPFICALGELSHD